MSIEKPKSNKTIDERAEAGELDALIAVAYLFEIGLDRPKDLTKATEYWQKAADAGDPAAQLKISSMKVKIDKGDIAPPAPMAFT
jgi:TPR repeat protein